MRFDEFGNWRVKRVNFWNFTSSGVNQIRIFFGPLSDWLFTTFRTFVKGCVVKIFCKKKNIDKENDRSQFKVKQKEPVSMVHFRKSLLLKAVISHIRYDTASITELNMFYRLLLITKSWLWIMNIFPKAFGRMQCTLSLKRHPSTKENTVVNKLIILCV